MISKYLEIFAVSELQKYNVDYDTMEESLRSFKGKPVYFKKDNKHKQTVGALGYGLILRGKVVLVVELFNGYENILETNTITMNLSVIDKDNGIVVVSNIEIVRGTNASKRLL